MKDCQEIGVLISGYLDGELTQGSRQRVQLHLDDCPACRKVYDELARLQQDVEKMRFEEMSPTEWSAIMNDLTVKGSRGTGWLLLVVGAVVVIGYGAYEFAVDDTVPALIKSAVGAVVVGTALLFVSVLRQRLIARKSDRYRDVEI